MSSLCGPITSFPVSSLPASCAACLWLFLTYFWLPIRRLAILLFLLRVVQYTRLDTSLKVICPPVRLVRAVRVVEQWLTSHAVGELHVISETWGTFQVVLLLWSYGSWNTSWRVAHMQFTICTTRKPLFNDPYELKDTIYDTYQFYCTWMFLLIRIVGHTPRQRIFGKFILVCPSWLHSMHTGCSLLWIIRHHSPPIRKEYRMECLSRIIFTRGLPFSNPATSWSALYFKPITSLFNSPYSPNVYFTSSSST